MNHDEALHRIQNLSASQRALLQKRINERRNDLPADESRNPGSNQLTAWVVCSDVNQTAKSIRTELSGRLPSALVPRAINLVNALPKNANGKIDRSQLLDQIPETAHQRSAPDQVDPDVARLCRLCESILGCKIARPSDSFTDLGGDSFSSIQFVAVARKQGFSIDPSDVLSTSSLSELIEIDRNKTNASQKASPESTTQRSEQVLEIRSGIAQGSVLFAHEIGGQCHYANHLSQHLDTRLAQFVTQQTWDPAELAEKRSLGEMAAAYVDQWLDHDPIGPHYVVSFCWGALLGYEICQQMQQRNKPVDVLCVIDFGTEASFRHASTGQRAIAATRGMHRRLINRIGGLGNNESMGQLAKSLAQKLFRSVSGKPQEVGEFQFAENMGPPELIQQNVRRYFDYQIAQSDQVMHLFRSKNEMLIGARYVEPTYGWKYLVGERIQTHSIDGNHDQCVQPPHAYRLAESLNQVLLTG